MPLARITLRDISMSKLLSLLVLAFISLSTATAETLSHNGILLSDVWIRATPPHHGVSGGYLTIQNSNDKADRLVAVTADFAAQSEIHEMKMDGDIMKMRQMEDGLKIAGGSAVTLKPSGTHLMFMKLNQQIVTGERYNITLIFERAGTIDMTLQARKSASGHHNKHSH